MQVSWHNLCYNADAFSRYPSMEKAVGFRVSRQHARIPPIPSKENALSWSRVEGCGLTTRLSGMDDRIGPDLLLVDKVVIFTFSFAPEIVNRNRRGGE